MPFDIDPGVVLLDGDAIRDSMEALIDPDLSGYWSMVQEQDQAVARQVAEHNAVAGYFMAAYSAIEGAAFRVALHQAAPLVVEAAGQAAELEPSITTVPDGAKLAERLGEWVIDPSASAWLEPQLQAFRALKNNIVEQGLLDPKVPLLAYVALAVGADNAAQAAEAEDNEGRPANPGGQPTAEELKETTTERSRAVGPTGVRRLRTREQKELIDRNPLKELPAPPWNSDLLISSPPKGGLYWVRWSAVEHPPLAKGEYHMLYMHDPVSDPNAFSSGGDSPSINEVPGGTVLSGQASTEYTSGHVGQKWVENQLAYWVEMPGRADFVRLGDRVHFYMALPKDGPQGIIDWPKLRELIEKQLKESDAEDEIKDAVKDFLEDLLDGVTFLGFSVGKAAGVVAKGVASLAMSIVDWLIEEVFGDSRFPAIVVLHKTQYNGAHDPISHVSWFNKHPNSEKQTPIKAKQVRARWWRLSSNQQYSGVRNNTLSWTGQCEVPTRGPNPSRMVNTREGLVIWTEKAKNGGHAFVSIKTLDGDGHYVVALRTEVRLAHVLFE